ncbi:hypothetical protein CsSME_00051649 [Camellia sinensis var. sinensis]
MDKCHILELVHQANEGYKVDKGFKDQAYIAACSSLNSSFNLSLSREHCVNHLKTIKKKYRLIQEMLSKSGFSWNPMTKMVECSDQELTVGYIHKNNGVMQANPYAKGLQDKKIEMLDELSIVSGNDQATGEWACSAKDVNANYSKKTNDSEDDQKPTLGKLPCIDYLELYKAVMHVEELDINGRMTTFESLNGDPIKAKTFLIYPQDMCYLFLI